MCKLSDDQIEYLELESVIDGYLVNLTEVLGFCVCIRVKDILKCDCSMDWTYMTVSPCDDVFYEPDEYGGNVGVALVNFDNLQEFGDLIETKNEGSCSLFELGDEEFVVLPDNTVITRKEDNSDPETAIFPFKEQSY